MSIKVINLVWDTPCKTHTQKLVLIALADNSNDQHVCWPSIDYLARRCDLSRQGVMNQIDGLIKVGKLKVRKSDGRVNVYEVLPNQSTALTGQSRPPVNPVGTHPSTPLAPPVNPVGPNHKEPPQEPPVPLAPRRGKVRSERQREAWQQKQVSDKVKALWIEAYKKQFPGTEYQITGADGGQLRLFLNNTTLTPEQIIQVAIDSWKKKGDRFTKSGNLKSLCYLCTKFNEIRAEIDSKYAPKLKIPNEIDVLTYCREKGGTDKDWDFAREWHRKMVAIGYRMNGQLVEWKILFSKDFAERRA